MIDLRVTGSRDETVSPGLVVVALVCYAGTVVVFPNVAVVVRDLSLPSVPGLVAGGMFGLWLVAPSLMMTFLIVRYGIPIPVSGNTTVVGRLSRDGASLSLGGSVGWYALILVGFPLVYYVTVVALIFTLRLPGLSQVATQLPLRIVEPGPLALGSLLPVVFLVVNALLPPVALLVLKIVSLAGGSKQSALA